MSITTVSTKDHIKLLREMGKQVFYLRTARTLTSEDEQTMSAIIKEALNKQYRQLGMETYTE